MNIKDQIQTVVATSDGITCEWAEGCTLTDEQKADIEAGQIIHKWATQIPAYLDECAVLRNDNPTMSDRTIRALARAGFTVGT
tara:strand:+ start:171 stop:419 length:249 start_codon:yes stop_codon:yes gene_type:complete